MRNVCCHGNRVPHTASHQSDDIVTALYLVYLAQEAQEATGAWKGARPAHMFACTPCAREGHSARVNKLRR